MRPPSAPATNSEPMPSQAPMTAPLPPKRQVFGRLTPTSGTVPGSDVLLQDLGHVGLRHRLLGKPLLRAVELSTQSRAGEPSEIEGREPRLPVGMRRPTRGGKTQGARGAYRTLGEHADAGRNSAATSSLMVAKHRSGW